MYVRRDNFRYLVKKGVHGKNNLIRGLSALDTKKLNGYEIIENIKNIQKRK